jgi:hypothetical protein
MEASGQLQASAALTKSNHWIGGCVGPGAGLVAVARRKNSIIVPYRELNPVVQSGA